MESLIKRLEDVETVLDVDNAKETSVGKSLQQLQRLIDNHIESNPALKKLVAGIDRLKLNYDDKEILDDEQIRYERTVVLVEIDKIGELLNHLNRVKSLEKNYLIEVNQIDSDHYLTEIKNLQLRYNYLLIRSINLLQNFFNLNENINKWAKYK